MKLLPFLTVDFRMLFSRVILCSTLLFGLFFQPYPACGRELVAVDRDTRDQDIRIVTGAAIWTFGVDPVLTLKQIDTRLDNGHVFPVMRHPSGRPLYDLAINGVLPANAEMNEKGGYDWKPGLGRIEPNSFQVVAVRQYSADGKETIEVNNKADTAYGVITAAVKITAGQKDELLFEVNVSFDARDQYFKTTLRGPPVLEEILIGQDDWYFMNRGRGVFSDAPCRRGTYYGQYAWMQCLGCYGKDTKLVLSMVPYENRPLPKSFHTQKAGEENERITNIPYSAPLYPDLLNSKGITQIIAWPDWVTPPGGVSHYGPVAVRIHPGDWRDIYGHYQEYLRKWWQPKPQNRQWIRHNYLREGHHPYCGDTFEDYVDFVLSFQDHVEFMLAKPMNLSCYLDYSLIEPDNPEAIRRLVEAWHQKGARATVYVHGKAIDPADDFAKAHAYDLTLESPPPGQARGGPPGTGAADGLHWINLHTHEWRNWLGKIAVDILEKTKADGIRLDTIGFTMFGGGNGSNPRIHTPPTRHDWQVKASVDTVAHIRSAMNEVKPEAVLGAEQLGPDRMMNILDYSISYNIWDGFWAPKEQYPSPVSYIRFVFPDFKFLEFILCVGPDDNPIDAAGYPSLETVVENGRFTKIEDMFLEPLQQILFNGVGYAHWVRAPSYIPVFKTMQRVLQENTHCFEGACLIPEVPTLNKNIYANVFAEKKEIEGPRVITLMNWSRQRIEGPLVDIQLQNHEQVVEMVHLNNIKMDQSKALLALDPMRTAVLRVIPGNLHAALQDDSVIVSLPEKLHPDQKIVVYSVANNGIVQRQNIVKMKDDSTAVISGKDQYKRIAVQLMKLIYHDSVNNIYVIDDMLIID